MSLLNQNKGKKKGDKKKNQNSNAQVSSRLTTSGYRECFRIVLLEKLFYGAACSDKA